MNTEYIFLSLQNAKYIFLHRRQKEKRVTPEAQVSPMSCYGSVQVTGPAPGNTVFGSGAKINFSAYDQIVTGRQQPVKTEVE